MEKYLNKTETRNYVLFNEHRYNKGTLKRCRMIMDEFKKDGKTTSSFEDSVWNCFSGVKIVGISFAINADAYKMHVGVEFGIGLDSMVLMLKCFAVSLFGSIVLDSIVVTRINSVKRFLETYGEPDVAYHHDEILGIKEFLVFIDTPKKSIDEMLWVLESKKELPAKQRVLQPFVTYLAIDAEIERLFEQESMIDDSMFIRLFPVYFWVKVSFIIPMRPTEIILTPFNCISRENDKVFISIRRTRLKKKRKTVNYSVDSDYEKLTYPLSSYKTAKNIEKYIALTESHQREYLFDYNDKVRNQNGLLSKRALEGLLDSFVLNNVNGNPRYNFARKASGIVGDFKTVNIGDSRHLALINLILSGTLPHICQEIAGHEHIDTTAGYYSNLDKIIMHSAYFDMQKKINSKRNYIENNILRNSNSLAGRVSFCLSEKRLKDYNDISDCIAQKHLHECIGCKFYQPTEMEEKNYFELEMKKLNETSKRFIDSLSDQKKTPVFDLDSLNLYNELKTAISRFTVCSEAKARKEAITWQTQHDLKKK